MINQNRKENAVVKDLMPIWIRGDAVAAHDLLKGLTFQPAGLGRLSDISLAQGKHVPDIDGIEGAQMVLFGLLVGQVQKRCDFRDCPRCGFSPDAHVLKRNFVGS